MADKCARSGCNNLPRQNSKYCSKYCSDKAWRDKHNQETHYSRCFPNQRGAIIFDPLCASPYHMTIPAALECLKADEFYVGTVVIIGDERREVR